MRYITITELGAGDPIRVSVALKACTGDNRYPRTLARFLYEPDRLSSSAPVDALFDDLRALLEPPF